MIIGRVPYSTGRGQRVVAGVVAGRAFAACLCVATRRQAPVTVAFDDEVGVGKRFSS